MWSTLTFLLLLLACPLRRPPPTRYGMSSGSRSASFSVPTSRDVLWERALSALPHVLLSALRAAELDDPRVLIEYPTGRIEDLETLLGETFGKGGAPSGAASSEQSPSTSGNFCTAIPLNSSGTTTSPGGLVESVVSVGGDPRTDQECCDEASSVVTGGDPKTDRSLRSNLGASVDSPQSGGLATQTAITVPVSPGLNSVFAFSHGHDPVHPDGFPSSQISEVHDGWSTNFALS